MVVKRLRWDTRQDVMSRLGNSVVMVNNRPVYIFNDLPTRDELSIIGLDLERQKTIEEVHSSDESVQFRNLTPGYVNSKGGGRAIFTVRAPVRRYKQGLCRDNTFEVNSNGKLNPLTPDFFRTKNFGNMLLNDYPSYEKAMEIVKTNEMESIAISKKFAIIPDELGLVKLFYMNNPIAWYNKYKESFILPEKTFIYSDIIRKLNVPYEILRD